MISELERLLADAGYRCPAGGDLREFLLITRNHGSIPVTSDQHPGFAGRGFQLVLLDRRGNPSHYARCRWADDILFARECEYVTVLAMDEELAGLMPRFRTASSSTLRVLVSEYLSGGTHLGRLRRQSARSWLRAARSAAGLRDRLSERAHLLLPSLNNRLRGEVPSRIASERLDTLVHAGLPLDDARALASAVGPLDDCPGSVQHGDFWPGNLIRHQRSWWLIDYEEFGTVFAPLFDVLHFLQQTARIRAWGSTGPWLGEGASAMPSSWKHAFGSLLDGQIERLGMSPPQLAAAVTFYVVRMGSHRLRPGVSRQFAEPLLEDARTIARWARGSGALEDLLTWSKR